MTDKYDVLSEIVEYTKKFGLPLPESERTSRVFLSVN